MEESLKPRLRGLSHVIAFVAALVGCVRLAQLPVQGMQYASNLVFGCSLVLMFGVSGGYHWPTWSAATYQRIRRFDHAAIFILIAGSFTPLATLDPMGGLSQRLLWVMWGAALTGATLTLAGISASRGLRSGLYVALGFVAAPVFWNLPGVMGQGRVGWLFFGAMLYAVGAVVYARRWPDPIPHVFGYHEVFHVMVVAAAATHYAVLLDFVGR
ncbi:hemolysin III [Corallococcus sp. AB011P]|uniref:PAQR family membrane homeostasis protein TrhA n=1 Tax=unclassified Corallococcus TaxID=2685029 RepID=UPI000EA12CC4|nr:MULTISPECIES: hemolysin III family protein [unclassified Corallococcus]RKG48990.1 hemolysin III [Corallococcus sp. AB011P]RKH82916.1 hemolysin III [Corallococcus sp. AB045]